MDDDNGSDKYFLEAYKVLRDAFKGCDVSICHTMPMNKELLSLGMPKSKQKKGLNLSIMGGNDNISQKRQEAINKAVKIIRKHYPKSEIDIDIIFPLVYKYIDLSIDEECV
jgi:hypothetical protein